MRTRWAFRYFRLNRAHLTSEQDKSRGTDVIGSFTYEALPQRVLFGPGRAAEVATELRRLSCRRALVLSTKEQRDAAERMVDRLGELAGGIFAGAVMHTHGRDRSGARRPA
jgi:hypothetical protein